MKLNKLLAIFVSACMLYSCDFMDCSETDYYELDELQESYSRVKQYVTNVYGYLPSNFCNIDGAMLDAATDDAVHVYETSTIQRFVNGTWSPNYVVDDQYANYYNGIHDANFYLENFTGLDFSSWENTNNYDDWMVTYPNFENEIRFLRAYFYFELVRRYQNIPLVTKTMTEEEANAAEPATAQQILDFIISECSDLSEKLPVDYSKLPNIELGRATKACALALKARAALYAASPLYNTTNDNSKWVTAAEAAYELIGQKGELGVDLDTNFSNLFGDNNLASKEVILARPTGSNSSFESANFPMGVTGGNTTTCPTENLASAYELTDGTAFDWNNPQHAANPYKNRDPRFYLTIVHNGMLWPAKKAVEIFEGGANGQPLTNATTTGYYLRKYVNNSISFEAGSSTSKTNHNWILSRYAEVLLNYAEAMVNAYGDINVTTEKCKMSALQAINAVRGRKGVEMPALSSTLPPAEFLEKVKHERRVELAFEGHRFWDLRRWEDLDESKDIYSVKIVKNGDGITYTKSLMEERKIEDKLYFYPIANTELFKNSNLKQNPGW